MKSGVQLPSHGAHPIAVVEIVTIHGEPAFRREIRLGELHDD